MSNDEPERELQEPIPEESTVSEVTGADADPTIRLDHFLKLCGLVGTGGQAKLLVQNGEIIVNGELETRRRRQLREGDVVEWGEEVFEVERDG